jgi:transcriptional regulator with XRE-family HTH domain
VTHPADLGGRLRTVRKAKNISLRELARRIDVSPSLISQIETDKIHPSVSTLYALASELGASVDQLLFEDTGPTPTEPTVSETDPVRDHPNLPPLQKADTRQVIRLSSGVRWERLTAESVPGIDFLLVVYPPGGESAPADAMQRHAGREWGYVISGTLHVTIAFEDHILEPGDAIAFDSTVPHRLYNPGEDDVRAVWFTLGRNSGHS